MEQCFYILQCFLHCEIGSKSVKQVLNSYATQKRSIFDIKQHIQSVSAMVTYIIDFKKYYFCWIQ